MSRFNVFLHRTGERLALPKATRSLILVEIASDLEDLFQHYLQQGLSEEEAAQRAEEKVDMSNEALAELVRIHSDARGWTDRMVRRVQPFWERIAMALIVLFFLASATLQPNQRLFSQVTGFIWPILGILLALITFFIIQLTRFSDHPSPRALRNSLTTPLFLGAASVVVGFAGTGIELYRALMRMVADPEGAAPLLAKVVLESTTTLVIALLVTLCAGVVWFVLAGRVARLEDDVTRKFLGGELMSTLLRIFMQGGILMWPMVLIVLVLFGIVIRALWHLYVRGGNDTAAIQNCLDGLIFWGGFAVIIGVLGSVVGYNKAIAVLVDRGIANPKMVWMGTAEGMVSTIAGLLVLAVAGSIWYLLRWRFLSLHNSAG